MSPMAPAMIGPHQMSGTVQRCVCGVATEPNPEKCCARCLPRQVGIKKDLLRYTAVVHCPRCSAYMQPQRASIRAKPESPELLEVLLRHIRIPLARRHIYVSEAEFLFSEPNSKRLRLRLRVGLREEAAREKWHTVEFRVRDRLCGSCAGAQPSPDQCAAVVQLRQRVPHRRTFLYLEQLLLKHGGADCAVRVASAPHGLDFFFAYHAHAARVVDFLVSVLPIHIHTKTAARRLVSHAFSLEIIPVCSYDLVALDRRAHHDLGGLGPLVLCVKVTNCIALLDPIRLQIRRLDGEKCRLYDLKAALSSDQLVEYVVLDMNPTSQRIQIDGVWYQPADAHIARLSDFGKNDTTFTVRTHLGHRLNPGDRALGYDLHSASLDCDSIGSSPEDVILVKKSYEKWRHAHRWELKRMPLQEEEGEKRASDYEQFLKELEENPDMLRGMNLYKDKECTSEVAIEELITKLSLGEDGEGDADAGIVVAE